MSIFPSPHKDDYSSASSKHLEDAKILLTNKRYDGAGYLSGYVVECSLKAVLNHYKKDGWGHELDELSRDALRLATLPNGSIAKYIPRNLDLNQNTLLSEWTFKIRYKSEGLVPSTIASEWVQEANKIYIETIGEMRINGDI